MFIKHVFPWKCLYGRGSGVSRTVRMSDPAPLKCSAGAIMFDPRCEGFEKLLEKAARRIVIELTFIVE